MKQKEKIADRSPRVRVRFAPSPTGACHLGSARTALFNWLFARSQGGDFLVRVEDTDRARSTPEAVRVVFDSLEWLGLQSDEPPVRQSARRDKHVRWARSLLDRGKAYKCFATAEDLDEMRRTAKAEGRPMRYDRRWRDRPPKTDGSPFAIRIKAPLDGEVVINDCVQGKVTVRCEELDDMVLLRADGSPTYMLSVVVDDHDMGITHVIRGDDHLTNAFRQTILYQALGWQPPRFAHIPLIHGTDGAKMSKRRGDTSVLEYRDEGILPEALCNYLLRLGWGSRENLETFSLDEAQQHFTLEGIGRSPARFDEKKLAHLNGHWIRRLSPDDLFERVLPMIGREVPDHSVIKRALPSLQERATDLNSLRDSLRFYLKPPSEFDADGRKILLRTDDALWGKLRKRMDGTTVWNKQRLEVEIRDLADLNEIPCLLYTS
ncbi:MAG: glutamate--tRNA ligase, partial [Alphaproteobacteria bacterium]|nr:glutamate--tRNA ligase [Alphaproteobacteria bacterium]